jgi:hypothetical protein
VSRYSVSVAIILPNGQQGPNFNAILEAASFNDALERMKPALAQTLKDSNLLEVAAPAEPLVAEPPA